MPRTARKTIESSIYHVMLRGINRQSIFEDDEDRFQFMTVLTRYRELSDFRLHAFVLMSNHVHLLIEPAGEPLDRIFKRIGTSYAVWFNRKYERAGHLFQDRFRSEAVGTDQYYKTVLRYILRNPIKAGLVSSLDDYRWSSYLAYKKGKGVLTDTAYAMNLFGSQEALDKYLSQDNDDTVMDESDHDWRLRDNFAKEIIKRITGCDSVSDFQRFDLSAQKEYARKLYLEKLTLSQISRLTGMSKTTVHRTIQSLKDESETKDGIILCESETVLLFDPGIIW